MDNDQYAFLLAALARIDKKLEILLEINGLEKDFDEGSADDDEFEEEFDM